MKQILLVQKPTNLQIAGLWGSVKGEHGEKEPVLLMWSLRSAVAYTGPESEIWTMNLICQMNDLGISPLPLCTYFSGLVSQQSKSQKASSLEILQDCICFLLSWICQQVYYLIYEVHLSVRYLRRNCALLSKDDSKTFEYYLSWFLLLVRYFCLQ